MYVCSKCVGMSYTALYHRFIIGRNGPAQKLVVIYIYY